MHEPTGSRPLLCVTTFGTFPRGAPASYLPDGTWRTEIYPEWTDTADGGLALATTPRTMGPCPSPALVVAMTIDCGISFTGPGTSSWQLETVSPDPRHATGPALALPKW